MKRFLFITTLLSTSIIYASPECFISGKLELSKSDFENYKIHVNSQRLNVSDDGYYCIKNKFNINNHEIKVFYKPNKEMILKTKLNPNLLIENKYKNYPISLDNLFYNSICNNKCDLHLSDFIYLPEYKKIKQEILDKYYNDYSKFSYPKVLRAIKKEKHHIEKLIKKNISNNIDKYYTKRTNVKGHNYNNYNYNQKDISYYKDSFLNNNNIISNLNDRNLPDEIIFANFIRELYYNGKDLNNVSSLYSDEYKKYLISHNKYNKPLYLTTFYSTDFRDNTLVRDPIDFKIYKKIISDNKKFLKKESNKLIYESDYLYLSFIYENNMWKLDKFKKNN